MQAQWTLTRLSLLSLGLAAGLAAADASPRQQAQVTRAKTREADDAEGRRAWNRYWFGDVTRDYLVFKNRAAAHEIERWRDTFPHAGGRLLPTTRTGPTWTNLGPLSGQGYIAGLPDIDSGRLVSVVTDITDAKTLYLATAGGGVWKCTNADLLAAEDWTWTPITDALPAGSSSGNIAIGALAMSPADHLTLFLGLGDSDSSGYTDSITSSGIGMYLTHDGGATWAEAGDWTQAGNTSTRTRAILPVSSTLVLASTNDGLWRSIDGGSHWARPAGIAAGTNVWSIQAFSATELICTAQDAGGVGTLWYSSDAGATWTQATATLTSPGRITVATSPASATQAWGIYEDASSGNIKRGLLKTTDKGHSWTFVAAPTTWGGLFQGSDVNDGGQGFYNQCLAVDPTNINNVFVGANLALYRTLDGGASWVQMTDWLGGGYAYAHPDLHCSSWAKTGTKTLFIGNDGGLCIVRDPLRADTSHVGSDPTFVDNRRNKGLATHEVYSLGSTTAATPSGAQHEISLGLQDNGTRVRQGSGAALQTSSIFDEIISGDGFGTVIHQTDGTKILGSLYYSMVRRSTDSGVNFPGGSTGITEAGDGYKAPFATKIALGWDSAPDTAYTFTNGKAYKTTDWASSWTAMGTSGLPPAGANSTSDPADALYIRNIGASHSDDRVVGLAANQGRVFMTTNSGGSWVQSGPLPGGPSYNSYIWFDTTNPQIVYVASVAPDSTANHLWRSANRGASFSAIDGGGFPFGIPVHVIQNDPANHDVLFAGTDFGVYRSADAGATWARYGTGLPMVAVRDLYIAADGSFIRAATFGRGVWEMLPQAGVMLALDKTKATVAVGATTSFTATLSNTTTDNTANWTATSGSFSATNTASGVATTYTAPGSIGDFTVSATSVEDGAKKATPTVTTYNPATLAVAVTPGAKSLLTGGIQTFSATVTGAPSNAVAWTASGGSITQAGVFTAPAATGTYTITATAPYPSAGNSGTATVTVRTLDLNADTKVDPFDLLNFAKVYGPTPASADFNGNGVVDDTDLGLLLAGIQ